MNRVKFYKKITVDDTDEVDYLHNSLAEFKMVYEAGYYRVSEDDILRPDLISYKNYRTVSYWWIICYVNKISNPFEDIEVGDTLTIPNILDIYNFAKDYRVR